jgi:hypothetical protein
VRQQRHVADRGQGPDRDELRRCPERGPSPLSLDILDVAPKPRSRARRRCPAGPSGPGRPIRPFATGSSRSGVVAGSRVVRRARAGP